MDSATSVDAVGVEVVEEAEGDGLAVLVVCPVECVDEAEDAPVEGVVEPDSDVSAKVVPESPHAAVLNKTAALAMAARTRHAALWGNPGLPTVVQLQ